MLGSDSTGLDELVEPALRFVPRDLERTDDEGLAHVHGCSVSFQDTNVSHRQSEESNLQTVWATHSPASALLAAVSRLVVPGEFHCRLERSLLIAADVPTDEDLGRVAISTRGLLVQLPRVRHGVQPPDADLVLRDHEVDVDVLNVLNLCGAHRSRSNFLGLFWSHRKHDV